MSTPAPYWASDDGDVVVHLGDCLDVLRTLEADSIDAIVTDPPAGIAFMGRDWDDFRRARWRFTEWLAERMSEALRVLKPGGHLLAWSLPRTSHWTAWALEDAGLEIRDCILHLFGSGFPKSLDVSKAIDKAAGAGREVSGPKMRPDGRTVLTASPGGGSHTEGWDRPWRDDPDALTANGMQTTPATEDAARWEGWGTALKPGQEMWWLARKPLKGTVAASVLEFGTGALNIDGCKVEGEERQKRIQVRNGTAQSTFGQAAGKSGMAAGLTGDGRWPANIVFTHSAACDGRCAPDCPAGELDRQSGVTVSGQYREDRGKGGIWTHGNGVPAGPQYGDSGGASRFYPVFRYQAKAPASERPRLEDGTAHETVKPLGLMAWLVRLITPPGGTVLDMFAGSGPVAEACIIEGFRCVLIEQDPKSAALIRKRLGKPIQPVMVGLEDAGLPGQHKNAPRCPRGPARGVAVTPKAAAYYAASPPRT